jgi:predicted membrane-bound spermidine synthase
MPIILIYIIACLEGFTTLAIQMIILRLAIPITGSSIVVTSIFLGIILLALSFGYWWGGRIAEKSKEYREVAQEEKVVKVSKDQQGTQQLTTIL